MTTIINDPPFKSTMGFKYPQHRDDQKLCSDLWLEDKRNDDGAEGLWRIHDDLYDLNDWIDLHPGGKDWIRLTKGTDITEAFESHHISNLAEQMLPNYYIRKAIEPRNSPYTFKSNGFYKTLKKNIQEPLKSIPDSATTRTKIMTDSLLLGYVATAILSIYTFSFTIGAASGILLSLVTIASHNYFHQKDTFRMFYFDLSFMSSREWRISHAMSHHLFTNTVNDLEISLPQPFLTYLPAPGSPLKRILSIIISPGFYVFLFVGNGIKRYILAMQGVVKDTSATELIPYTIPLIMYIFGSQPLAWTILMWLWIVTVGSFYFGFIGVNAAHHHPSIFHDGDTPREDRDWGLAQVDAVMDRKEITGSPFLVLTSFGDHTLHHLFPTIDHGKLKYLYPVLKETLREFGVKFRLTTQWELILGQYCQLLRMVYNPLPPGKRWHWYETLFKTLKDGIKDSFSFLFFAKNKTQ